eukprot:5976479-Pyramimonas_sp.AAC.1
MTGTAAVSMTTPAGQPGSPANAGPVTEATTLAGTPAIDMPMPLVAETENNAGGPARSAPPSVPVSDARQERSVAVASVFTHIHAIWARPSST